MNNKKQVHDMFLNNISNELNEFIKNSGANENQYLDMTVAFLIQKIVKLQTEIYFIKNNYQ